MYLGGRKQSAKGVTKYSQTKLHHELYKQVLVDGALVRSTKFRITSVKDLWCVVHSRQISLNAFDNKGYILPCGIETIPHGYYTLESDEESIPCAQPSRDIHLYPTTLPLDYLLPRGSKTPDHHLREPHLYLPTDPVSIY